jgi:hypothetical protein
VSSIRKPIGIGLTIGGGAALAGALVAGLMAQSKYSDAKQACGGMECSDPITFARGQALVDQARSRGNISTALTIGGGVLVTAGLVIWLTAPTEERITITPTTNGVSVSGHF